MLGSPERLIRNNGAELEVAMSKSAVQEQYKTRTEVYDLVVAPTATIPDCTAPILNRKENAPETLATAGVSPLNRKEEISVTQIKECKLIKNAPLP